MPTTKSGKEIATNPELWEKAKKKAKDQGQAENWALINHIYQQMGGKFKGGDINKASEFGMDESYEIIILEDLSNLEKADGRAVKYIERWMGEDGKWNYKYKEAKGKQDLNKVKPPHKGENTEWYTRHLPSPQEWAAMKAGDTSAMRKYVNRTIWSSSYVKEASAAIGGRFLQNKTDYKPQDGIDLIKDVGTRLIDIMDRGKLPEKLQASQMSAFVGGVYKNVAREQLRQGGRIYDKAVSLNFRREDDDIEMIDTIKSTYISAEEEEQARYVHDMSLKIMDGVAKRLKAQDPEKAKKIWWLLKAQNKSRKEVAKEVGVVIQTVHNIEKQGEKLAWDVARKLRFDPTMFFKAKKELEILLDLIKAKKREEGEIWTQPSGARVTKKGGKIIPAPEGSGGDKKEDTPESGKQAHGEEKSEGGTDAQEQAKELKNSIGDLIKNLSGIKDKIKETQGGKELSKQEFEKQLKAPVGSFSKRVSDILFGSLKGTATDEAAQKVEEQGQEEKRKGELEKKQKEKMSQLDKKIIDLAKKQKKVEKDLSKKEGQLKKLSKAEEISLIMAMIERDKGRRVQNDRQ